MLIVLLARGETLSLSPEETSFDSLEFLLVYTAASSSQWKERPLSVSRAKRLTAVLWEEHVCDIPVSSCPQKQKMEV